MRKFIISDIHGLGNVYDSIMRYLDNINLTESVELYINGDIIDRGPDSVRILLDIKRRIKENKFKIVFLGGNHELMMYEVYNKRKKKILVPPFNDWYLNGGKETDSVLKEKINDNDKLYEVADFVGNLKIYHKFDEKIGGKNIVLVHAACPRVVNDECNIFIRDNNMAVFFSVWTRKEDFTIPFRCLIGNKNYFSIVGHTSNGNKYGYVYHKDENYLNIDGGCARYARGLFEYDHVPLVEVKDNYLRILTFNNTNEIIYGTYFDGRFINLIDDTKLNNERKLLIKKM